MGSVTEAVEQMRRDPNTRYTFDLNLTVDDVVNMIKTHMVEEMAKNFNIVTEHSDDLPEVSICKLKYDLLNYSALGLRESNNIICISIRS